MGDRGVHILFPVENGTDDAGILVFESEVLLLERRVLLFFNVPEQSVSELGNLEVAAGTK